MKKAAVETQIKKTFKDLIEEKKISIEVDRIQIEEKLTSEHPKQKKVGVCSFLFVAGELPDGTPDFVVGFIREPNFQVKKMAMDIFIKSLTDAGELILNTCIVQENSDPRIWGEDAEDEYPEIRMGAIMRAQELVSYNSDVIKKK